VSGRFRCGVLPQPWPSDGCGCRAIWAADRGRPAFFGAGRTPERRAFLDRQVTIPLARGDELANQEDVRRIASSLPGAREAEGRFAFSVENKGKEKSFLWVWLERLEPKKPREPRPDVIAVRVRDQGEKAALLAADPDTFFTEPHYNGFPAVLVRLRAVRMPLLRKLIVEAWRCQAPAALVKDGAVSQRIRRRPHRSSRGPQTTSYPSSVQKRARQRRPTDGRRRT
jgi:hypothetical protein